MGQRDKKLLYHLTALRNLASILETGLQSRQSLHSVGIGFADHADPEILEGRSGYQLAQFVPFHFMPRTPFDYAVVHNARADSFVLISVYRELARNSGWSIIPRHPLARYEKPEILPWDEGFEKIDWSQMDKFPRDYENDAECKHTCMAEALSPATVAATSFQSIFVPDDATRSTVGSLTQRFSLRCHINVNADMFPPGAGAGS